VAKLAVLSAVVLSLAAASSHAAMRSRQPLEFVWPTSVAVEPSGSLLVVENGLHQVERVDPRTGKESHLATNLPKPYAIAVDPRWRIFLSDNGVLERIRANGTRTPLANAKTDVGPIALASGGDVYYATAQGVFHYEAAVRLVRRIASGMKGPHGIAVARDGSILVSDTGHNVVKRIDPRSGAVTTLMKLETPMGLAVAADGTIDVVESAAKDVVRYSATGRRLSVVAGGFQDPYELTISGRALYVVDSTAAGVVDRVSPSGKVSPILGA
jgi:streptogramin lyase